MSDRLTHVGESGAARMVDVSEKAVTTRVATAAGRVLVSPEVVALLRGGGVPKGDAVAVARIAGIAGAKRTPDLVPLCHPIALHGVTVDVEVTDDAVEITATASNRASAGVYEDRSGQALAEGLRELGFEVDGPHVRPDDVDLLAEVLREAVASGADVVLTTGGTGLSPTDVTAEATRDVLER